MKRRAAPWRASIEAYLSALGSAQTVKQLHPGNLLGKVDLRGEPAGTWSLRSRVGGVIEQIWPGQTIAGEVMRASGAFLARTISAPARPLTLFAESLIIPDVLAERLYGAWSREREDLPARIPARLVFDYCLWTVAIPSAPRGAEVRAEGSHWTADPMLATVRAIAEGPAEFKGESPLHPRSSI